MSAPRYKDITSNLTRFNIPLASMSEDVQRASHPCFADRLMDVLMDPLDDGPAECRDDCPAQSVTNVPYSSPIQSLTSS
jgi:hypothetical protein